MEAGILIALLGAGYLFNKNNDDDINPINVDVDKEIHFPSMENTYNSDYYNETQKMVRNLASSNFEASQKPSNIVNFQKVENNTKLDIGSNNIKENFDNLTYSTSAGGYINNDEFLTNDQGIKVAPFFKNQPSNINFDDPRKLNSHQGNEFNKSKRETSNFGDTFVKNSGNVFGKTFDSHTADKTRYDNGMLKTNELPFIQERVAPIDFKSNFSREIAQTMYDKLDVDKLRTLNNPKLTYEGKVLAGKGIEHRGREGNVYKHQPETYYDNNADKWFVTNGAFLSKSNRPEEILPNTNRSYFNKQEFGIAAPSVKGNTEMRSNYKRSSNQQLGTDTVINPGSTVPLLNGNMQQRSYTAPPNERQVTELRTYDGNLKTENGSHKLGILDPIKQTIKETTIDSANNGYLGNNVDATTQRQHDSVRVTKKQTTIDSANNGYLTGYNELTKKPYDRPEWTDKDTTLYEYTGNAGAYIRGDMDKQHFENAETNPTREIISQGRAPTVNNTKLVNGMDKININIKKIDSDYENKRLNSGMGHNEIPNESTCKWTTTKDRLNDTSIANRIDPDLLNPFKQNPYTQPLTSFAY
jgi:hypothetical protein